MLLDVVAALAMRKRTCCQNLRGSDLSSWHSLCGCSGCTAAVFAGAESELSMPAPQMSEGLLGMLREAEAEADVR